MACVATETRKIIIVLFLWLLAATAAVTSGILAQVPPPVIVLALATLIVAVSLTGPQLRKWLRQADLKIFLIPHLIRFVGIAFLVLVNRGELAAAFVPIAWGDIIAAIGAVALLVSSPSITRGFGRWGWLAWNSFGLADMALLLGTGIRLASEAPEQFTLFRQLPFGLLPTFAVPLIIATHVFIYLRLLSRTPSKEEQGAG